MQNDNPECHTTEPLIPHGRLKTDRPRQPNTTDHMSELQRIGDLIRMIEANIEEREAAIKVIRKERSKLVAQRYRLQKIAGLK